MTAGTVEARARATLGSVPATAAEMVGSRPMTSRTADATGTSPSTAPLDLAAVILAIIAIYLLALELGKRLFYRRLAAVSRRPRRRPHEHRILRRAARRSVHHRVPGAEDLRVDTGRAA